MGAVQCGSKEDLHLATMLGQGGPTEQDASFQKLSDEVLASMESKLESSLRALRAHRQQRWEKQLRSVQRRHDEESKGRQSLEDAQACVVCSESAKAVLFMPCRHLCACRTCAARLVACPICRTTIKEQVQCIRP